MNEPKCNFGWAQQLAFIMLVYLVVSKIPTDVRNLTDRVAALEAKSAAER